MSQNIDDVVISSRIRLARNVNDIPFPSRLNDERASLIARKVYDALQANDNYDLYKMSNIGEIDGNVLMEKHLISADLLHNNQFGAAIINESETVSVMINEEDHIREQSILKGLQLREAYQKINAVDDDIAARIQFAFDPQLGYLTSCPTNLGTGLRASVMMFLPGLTITKNLDDCVNAVSRLNMTVRGVYGEGSDADGFIYQVSNQKTLGVSEAEIIESVETSINHIVDAELRSRQALLQHNEVELKDRILRAWGVLTNAYTLSTEEFMRLAAFVKLGVYYDWIHVTDAARLEKLITEAQPANLINISGKKLDAAERDLYRASYVGKVLSGLSK